MTVLRFQKSQGFSTAEVQRSIPAGGLNSVSSPLPGQMVDVDCTAGSVNDVTDFFVSRGWTLFATDPTNSRDTDSATVTAPAIKMKETAGPTVLTLGAIADGQVLTRSGSTVIGSASSSFDPRDLLAFDHFVAGSTTTERIGVLGWLQSVTGTGADLIIGGEVGHPGFLDMGAGTVAGGKAAVYLGDASFPLMILTATQNQIDMEWLIRFNTNALSSANNERFTLGWGVDWAAAAGTELTSGVYLEFNPSVSANFFLTTANASTRTKTDSTIAITANNWWRIGLQITYPAGVPTAKLLINGVVRATNTANFPVAGLGFGLRIDANATANEARCQADYMKMTQVTEKET